MNWLGNLMAWLFKDRRKDTWKDDPMWKLLTGDPEMKRQYAEELAKVAKTIEETQTILDRVAAKARRLR